MKDKIENVYDKIKERLDRKSIERLDRKCMKDQKEDRKCMKDQIENV